MAAIYVLCGDNFLKEKEVLKLKAEVLKSELAVLGYEKYEALSDDFSLLEESLQSPSLSGEKLILVENADRFDSPKIEKILSLSVKNETLTLILTSDKKDFAAQLPTAYKVNPVRELCSPTVCADPVRCLLSNGADGGIKPPSASIEDDRRLTPLEMASHHARFLTGLKSAAFSNGVNTKILDKIYPDKVPCWLMQRAKEKGTSVSVDAAEALVENLGNNLRLLDLSLDVLINFVNKERTIEKRDVEELVGINLNENIFVLSDAVAERNIERALKSMEIFLKTHYETQQILGILAWHFTRLLTAKRIIERYGRAQGQEKLQKMFSLRQFPLEKLMRQVNGFTYEQLEKAIRELFAADVRIKTLMTKPQYILETAIINLCGR